MKEKPHAAFLKSELASIRKRLVDADKRNSPERGYLLGVIDGMALVMDTIGMDTAPRPSKRGKVKRP